MKLTLTDDNGVVRDIWDSNDIDDIGVFEALAKTCGSYTSEAILRKVTSETIKKAESESES